MTSDRIREPLMDPSGAPNFAVARRRAGSLARAVDEGVRLVLAGPTSSLPPPELVAWAEKQRDRFDLPYPARSEPEKSAETPAE
jgi:hypothetical protein